MGLISRSTKVSGGTSLASNTLARAQDVETDVATLFTLVNGNLDSTNIPSYPASQITGTIAYTLVGDSSPTFDEAMTDATPGDSSAASVSLASNLYQELQRLRYALARLSVGRNPAPAHLDGTGYVDAEWPDRPARGLNLLANNNFDAFGETAGALDYGWVHTGTAATLTKGASDASLGNLRPLTITAGGADRGITQTLTLKADRRYLIGVLTAVSSGTMKLEVVGADATSDYRAPTRTSSAAGYTTVAAVIETDGTPTDIEVRLWSSGAAATFNVVNAFCLECSEEVHVRGGAIDKVVVNSTETLISSTSFAAVPGSAMTATVYVPGPNYVIRARAVLPISYFGTLGAARLTQSINGGGATSARVSGFWSANGNIESLNVVLDYCVRSPTIGASYAFAVELATTISDRMLLNLNLGTGTALGAFGAHATIAGGQSQSTLYVTLEPCG